MCISLIPQNMSINYIYSYIFTWFFSVLRSPEAAVLKTKTIFNQTAPKVVSFSGRGPNRIASDILKVQTKHTILLLAVSCYYSSIGFWPATMVAAGYNSTRSGDPRGLFTCGFTCTTLQTREWHQTCKLRCTCWNLDGLSACCRRGCIRQDILSWMDSFHD